MQKYERIIYGQPTTDDGERIQLTVWYLTVVSDAINQAPILLLIVKLFGCIVSSREKNTAKKFRYACVFYFY